MPGPQSPELAATHISPATDPMLGQAFGNFRVVRRLGSGGMGVVYLGEHGIIGSKVAIKVLHPHLAADANLVRRFVDEAKTVNLVGHENIVSVFDIGLLPPQHYFMVMEYLEGQPLSALLGRPLPLEIGLPVLLQVCAALEAAHAVGVVHRDLKPENVFLIRRGENERFVKVLDFGIAKLFTGVGGATAAGLVVGTPEYMPPEQWTGGAIDRRVDVYAIGVTAYEMFAGRRPFSGSNLAEMYRAHASGTFPPLRSLNPAVPEALEAVIARALARDPDARFPSAAAFASALRAVPRPIGAPASADSQAPLVAATATARPAPSPPRPKPAKPAESRPTWRARVLWAGLHEPLELGVSELSRAGMFLHLDKALPPLMTRVRVFVRHAEGELAVDAEVVRHVSPDQAKAWGLPPGFAVQIAGPSLEVARGLELLGRGQAPEAEAKQAEDRADDPEAERMLAGYRKRPSGDHYGVLGLAADAESSEIRHRARQASAEIEALAPRLSARQRVLADETLERIHAAMTILGNLGWRASHDANAGNFRGVARCLAAGLERAELEGLRAVFLERHPDNELLARARRESAEVHLGLGRTDSALHEFEAALGFDPLNLELQQRYWAVRRMTDGA